MGVVAAVDGLIESFRTEMTTGGDARLPVGESGIGGGGSAVPGRRRVTGRLGEALLPGEAAARLEATGARVRWGLVEAAVAGVRAGILRAAGACAGIPGRAWVSRPLVAALARKARITRVRLSAAWGVRRAR